MSGFLAPKSSGPSWHERARAACRAPEYGRGDYAAGELLAGMRQALAVAAEDRAIERAREVLEGKG